MTPEKFRDSARGSYAVRNELGPDSLQWVISYHTEDNIYCVSIAPDEDILLEHTRCLNIPADRISRVVATVDPTRAE